MLATAAQDPLQMASRGVEIGYQIMNGNSPEEPVILIPMELITRDNVAEYQGWAID